MVEIDSASTDGIVSTLSVHLGGRWGSPEMTAVSEEDACRKARGCCCCFSGRTSAPVAERDETPADGVEGRALVGVAPCLCLYRPVANLRGTESNRKRRPFATSVQGITARPMHISESGRGR